jgi:hypothetical protein
MKTNTYICWIQPNNRKQALPWNKTPIDDNTISFNLQNPKSWYFIFPEYIYNKKFQSKIN